jgi:hypothetical protein
LIYYRKTSFIHQFFYKFVGTDEYIQIIFISFGTGEYNVIFISLGQELMNIWDAWFDFDRPHIFISDMTYIHRLTNKYMGRRAAVTGPHIFVS